ncbi:MAG: WYL domain-containing protein [Elusimicrobia bacterium]|nr:WYL domain-containing protein [Elusimicrobiota bacterium]
MPQKDTLKRLGRILTLLARLDHGRIHVATLAKEFNVSKRALQRDLAMIHRAGFFTKPDDEPGYHKFVDGFSLTRRDLTPEQLATLAAMAGFSKNLGAGLSASFEKLFRHITDNSPWESYILPIMPKIKTDAIPFIQDIEYAIEYAKEIEIEYTSAEGKEVKRHVCPLKILIAEGFSYIFAFYKTKPDIFIKYRTDRIKSLKVIEGDSFTNPPGMDEALAKARNIWGVNVESDRKIKIRLKIDSWARDYFLCQELVGGQTIKQRSDGSLIYEATICQLPEIIPHILRWMPNVTVLSPKILRDEVVKRVDEFRNNHNN